MPPEFFVRASAKASLRLADVMCCDVVVAVCVFRLRLMCQADLVHWSLVHLN